MMRVPCSPVGSTAFRKPGAATEHPGVIAPLQLVTEAGMLSFLGTTTIFGTPIDITLSELVLGDRGSVAPLGGGGMKGASRRPAMAPACRAAAGGRTAAR